MTARREVSDEKEGNVLCICEPGEGIQWNVERSDTTVSIEEAED